MRVLLSAALLLTALPSSASQFEPFAGPTPLFVYIQTDPWAMVLGSDTPRIALYDNGELIFQSKVDNRFAYRHRRLDAAALHQFQQRLTPLIELKHLRHWYNISPNATDQPQTKFYVRDSARERTTQIYGLMAEGTELRAWTEFPGGKRPDRLPGPLLKLQRFLAGFGDTESPEWIPQYVEVMLWDYDYAPEESIHWPADWPGLHSDRAIQRGDGYSIFLAGTELPRLQAFLTTRREKGAVEVGGKKWAAEYRYTFPQERKWDAAFRKDGEAPVQVDFVSRLENIAETAKRAFSFFIFNWIPSLIISAVVVVAGFIRLRRGPISLSQWLILLAPLLIPMAIAAVTSELVSGVPGEVVKAIRIGVLVLVLSFLPLAGVLIFRSRGFRWFATAAMLLYGWTVVAFAIAGVS